MTTPIHQDGEHAGSARARAALQARLAPILGAAAASDVLEAVVRARQAEAVESLLEELAELSAKVTRAAIEALPELQAKDLVGQIVPWLDVAVAVAGDSGANALRYLKESPWLLAMTEPGARGPLLALAVELAEQDASLTLEFMRAAPELARAVPTSALPQWIEIGVELAERDPVLGPEFFRDAPGLAEILPVGDVRGWVELGLRLVTTNQFGKTDYYATIEYFRTSPRLLREVTAGDVRRCVVQLASSIAATDPQVAVEVLAEAPGLLVRIEDAAWQRRMLQYGQLVAERDAVTAREYLRRCPDIVRWQGYDDAARRAFEEWFKNGMEILAYSVDGARAYFALETKGALAAVQEAQSGVPLRQVARSLKLFVHALCGRDIVVEDASSDAASMSASTPGASAARVRTSADGRTLYFPAILRRHADREQNIRLYHVMAAHEAGHLEFGTYDLRLTDVTELIDEVRGRYGRPASTAVATLADLFALYPQPGIMRDLWTLLEDTRIERHLRREYPGLAADLDVVTREAVTTRSLSQGMTVREMLVDGLLIRSAEMPNVEMPEAIRAPLAQVWDAAAPVLAASATAADAVRTADHIYRVMDTIVGTYRTPADAPALDSAEPSLQQLAQGPGASDVLETDYRPLDNWNFRGALSPEFIGSGVSEQAGADASKASPDAARPDMGHDVVSASAPRGGRNETLSDREGASMPIGADAAPHGAAEEPAGVADRRRARWERSRAQSAAYRYDEWDGMLRDYRVQWCRVVETASVAQDAEAAEQILAAHRPAVRLLRRYFEAIRPPALRLVRGVTDGEDLDMDAAVGRCADMAAGVEPSDRVYVRRERRERDVAVAMLVDLSGSTSRRVGEDGQRVVDVEKASLILLCEALDAVGDHYAVYGFSGKGREQVDVTVLKEFGVGSRAETAARIGAMEPRSQNRDGAAIRHATRKLLDTGARVKLLIVLSDGKPLDDAYAEEYALEDTKMALREAVGRGVDPFCITVDREAESAVRRMYGDVRYVVIDRIEGLPEQLPRVYHRLTT